MLIEKVNEPTGEILLALQRLIPQLGPHKVPPGPDELAALLKSEGATLLIARDPGQDGEIIGTLCLTIYRVPTGIRSIVEDVVVEERMRRQGVGEALVRHAIGLARDAGAGGVGLTSQPQRVAANRLYQSMGFELRNTNAYIYKLNP
jgi:ribosomal protein S18 acetylase RimI-like enzyme